MANSIVARKEINSKVNNNQTFIIGVVGAIVPLHHPCGFKIYRFYLLSTTKISKILGIKRKKNVIILFIETILNLNGILRVHVFFLVLRPDEEPSVFTILWVHESHILYIVYV